MYLSTFGQTNSFQSLKQLSCPFLNTFFGCCSKYIITTCSLLDIMNFLFFKPHKFCRLKVDANKVDCVGRESFFQFAFLYPTRNQAGSSSTFLWRASTHGQVLKCNPSCCIATSVAWGSDQKHWMIQKYGLVDDSETWIGWWFKTGLVDDSEPCSGWLLVLMIQEWIVDVSETWIG